jgi:hypothetical protein
MAFADEYEKENRLLAYERRKVEEERLRAKAEVNFSEDNEKDTEKELYKMQGWFVCAVVALMFSLLGNFMQYISNHWVTL